MTYKMDWKYIRYLSREIDDSKELFPFRPITSHTHNQYTTEHQISFSNEIQVITNKSMFLAFFRRRLFYTLTSQSLRPLKSAVSSLFSNNAESVKRIPLILVKYRMEWSGLNSITMFDALSLNNVRIWRVCPHALVRDCPLYISGLCFMYELQMTPFCSCAVIANLVCLNFWTI